MPKEVKVTVRRVMGAATVFMQGGSLRLVLPKKLVRMLGVDQEDIDSEQNTFIILETDKGLILRPVKDYLSDEEMRMN